MRRRLMECAILLGLLICASPAPAQTVLQSGSVTTGHIASWAANGVIKDGGGATANYTIGGGSTVSVPSNTTEYCSTAGCAASLAIASTTSLTGTATNLYASVATAPGGGQTVTATLLAGPYGSLTATALTCIISGTATSCSDITHQVNIPAGQAWAVQFVTSSGASSTAGQSYGAQLISTAPPSPTAPYTLQSGQVTAGHSAVWTTNGVIQDGGVPVSTAIAPGPFVSGDLVYVNNLLQLADSGTPLTNVVIGPASVSSGDFVSFNGTGGKLIQDTGISAGTQSPNLFLATPSSGSGAPAFRAIANADFGTQSANLVFAGPTSGGAAVPTFRALVSGDLPAVGVTIAWGTNVGLTTSGCGPVNLGGTCTLSATSDTPRWTALGLGIAAPATGLRIANALVNPSTSGNLGYDATNGLELSSTGSNASVSFMTSAGVQIAYFNNSSLNTVNAGVNINPTAASTMQGLLVTQSGPTSGSATNSCFYLSNAVCYNLITITSDQSNPGNPGGSVAALAVSLQTGGSNGTGTKNAGLFFIQRNAADNTSGATFPDDIGLQAGCRENSANGGTTTASLWNGTTGARGTCFALNPAAVLLNGATNFFEVSAGEADCGILTGASSRIRMCWSIVDLGNLQAATSIDAALTISAIGTAPGFKTGIMLGSMNGGAPISSGGTAIGTDGVGITITNFIDFSAWACTGNYISFSNMVVTCAGTTVTPIVEAAVSSASATLTLQSTGGTGTSDKIIFKTGSQVQAGFINTSQQWMFGASTFTPGSSALTTFSFNTGTPAIAPESVSPATNIAAYFIGADTKVTQVVYDTYGNTSGNAISWRSAAGTAASPTVLLNNSFIGGFYFFGAKSTTVFYKGAAIFGQATENYSATNGGTQIQLYATPNGGQVLTQYFGVGGPFTVALYNIAAGAGAGALCGVNNMTGATGGAITYQNNAACTVSLRSVKRDIETLAPSNGYTTVLDEVMALQPRQFFFRDGYVDSGAHQRVGLVADEVERIDPRMASYDGNGKLNGVDYVYSLAVAFKAIQELKADNGKLRAEMAQLRKAVGR